jgi:2-polyprenyl-6-methoxyphenol hydroxylase-like FAD-dependent oxidoreductase
VALIGADGVKSAVRAQYVGDQARVSGHVVSAARLANMNAMPPQAHRPTKCPARHDPAERI